MKKERGLTELSAAVWSRRDLLKVVGRGALAIPYARFLSPGFIPVALAETPPGTVLAEKPDLRVLNDRPLNMEVPAHLLDDEVTPAERFFVRNNGIPPAAIDARHWTLEVAGEACENPQAFSIVELKRRFAHHTYQLQLECGGNGRAEFRPRVPGNQWTTGAIGCAEWTGVRLGDVLEACGVRGNAVYVGYVGADRHLSGDPDKVVISRGVPITKALERESLIAFAMNGGDIPALHGPPLRLVCGGWPASVSGKWLTRLLIRDRVHDGEKMGGKSYRVPCHGAAPGERVADDQMCIIGSMPVKSLVTSPRSGSVAPVGRSFEVRGHGWAGDRVVRAVDLSINFGATWLRARLEDPPNRLAWQRWRASVTLPAPGYYEIWAKATDEAGVSQPMLVPGWNPKGYLNNATHRIAVRAV